MIQQPSDDQSLASRAASVLGQSEYSELHSIQCNAQANLLTLRGVVRSYFHKQLAQAALLHEFPRSVRIHNEVIVRDVFLSQRKR